MDLILVEDDDGDARIIEDLLSAPVDEPVTIRRARSIADFVALGDHVQADCVLLDLCLPDANGVQAVSVVNALRPDLPIVVLTGSDDDQVARQALLAGAQDFLTKSPDLSADVTRRAIRHAVDRAAQTRALRASRTELRSFAHRIAHDLKSPLSVLVGAVDILHRGEMGKDAETREFLEMVQRSTGRLLEMVDRLLEYAESAGTEAAPTTVALEPSDRLGALATIGSSLEPAQPGVEDPPDRPGQRDRTPTLDPQPRHQREQVRSIGRHARDDDRRVGSSTGAGSRST